MASGSSSSGAAGYSASAARTLEQAFGECKRILDTLMGHKDAEPFLAPVKWQEWGLKDYPKVIKHPMDLGTVKAKLEKGQYKHPKEFKHDVSLVWNNCMTYNVEGSDYHTMASGLKQIFEERYAKYVHNDDEAAEAVRPPSLIDKKMFSQNIYNISAEDLGRLVHLLDERCEACIKKIDPEDIEIDIDSIDAATFWAADRLVRDSLPGPTKKAAATSSSKAKAAAGRSSSSSSSGVAAGGAGVGAGAGEGTKAKKPRTT